MSASASAATAVPAVAWVESPLQLINAIEFAAATGTPLVVEPRAGVLQLDETIEAVRPALPAGVTVARPVASADREDFRSAAHQVVGDVFSGQFRLLVARWGVRRLTIVDDGSATVHFAAALDGAPFVRMAQVESRAMQILGALVKRRILTAARRGRVALFTAYEGESTVGGLSGRGIRIIGNSYSWLRSLSAIGAAPASPRVVLGSALVTDRQIGLDNYLGWLRGLAAGGSISYLPHRREDAAQRAAVAALDNVIVEAGTLPAELALGSSQTLERVDTLPSSAVVTLRAILPADVPIRVSPVPASWWLPGSDPSIRRAFDQLARKDDTHVD